MKQIYDFGRHTPPALNERMLREALERRSLRRQTLLLLLAGCLLLAAFVLLAYSAMDWYPLITWLCLGYDGVIGGVIAVVYSRKGGKAA